MKVVDSGARELVLGMNSAFDRQLRAAFADIAFRRSAMIETLQKWCNQNSGSYNLSGLHLMADMLRRDFESLGLAVESLQGDEVSWIDGQGQLQSRPTADLLRIDHNPTASRRVLLMIHYDTVYPPDAEPSQCKMEASGRLVGPGTADAKGGLLIILESLRTVRRFEFDRNIGWTVLLNPDEEIGSPASARWMRQHAGEFDFGLLFEPTLPDGSLVSSRKGSGNFSLTVRGRSAHAGRNPEYGRNAVVHLCRLLVEIDSLGEKHPTANFNVARFEGGTALNQVPDLAIGRFNIRVQDEDSQNRILGDIENLVRRYDAAEGYEVVLNGTFQSPPKLADASFNRVQHLVQQACQSAGRIANWRSTGGSCDGSRLAAAGLPNVDTMGPTGGNLHSADEWVDCNTILPAAKTVVALIAQYANSSHDPQN